MQCEYSLQRNFSEPLYQDPNDDIFRNDYQFVTIGWAKRSLLDSQNNRWCHVGELGVVEVAQNKDNKSDFRIKFKSEEYYEEETDKVVVNFTWYELAAKSSPYEDDMKNNTVYFETMGSDSVRSVIMALTFELKEEAQEFADLYHSALPMKKPSVLDARNAADDFAENLEEETSAVPYYSQYQEIQSNPQVIAYEEADSSVEAQQFKAYQDYLASLDEQYTQNSQAQQAQQASVHYVQQIQFAPKRCEISECEQFHQGPLDDIDVDQIVDEIMLSMDL